MFFRVYYNQRSEIQEEHRRDLEVIRMLTKQQKHEQDMQRIRKFRLFDDDFLKKCFEDHDECADFYLINLANSLEIHPAILLRIHAAGMVMPMQMKKVGQ